MRLIVVAVLRLFFPYKLEHQLTEEAYHAYAEKNATTLLKIAGWGLVILLGTAFASALVGHLLHSIFDSLQHRYPISYKITNQLIQIVTFIATCKLLLLVWRNKLHEDFEHAVLYLSIENKVDISQLFTTGYRIIIFVMIIQLILFVLNLFSN